MALSRKQRHLANLIVKIGRQRGATRKEIVSALETGWVEARFSNPRGGSGTSVGWRQETASSYPGVNRRNLRKSINRYYNETRRAGRGRGKTAGQLAQSVQRSAYPGRYDASRGLALRLYRHSPRGGGGASGGGGGGARGRPGVPGMSSSSRTVTIGGHQIPEGSTGLATFLAAQLSQAQSQPMLSAPPAPSFSARNRLALPQGYGTPIENPPPPLSESKLADQLKQIQGLVGPTIQHPAVSVATANARTAGIAGTRGRGGGSIGGGGARGKVRIAHGADRPGVHTKGVVRRFVSRVSGLAHQPITITTGTNHNRNTVNGTVSDHWSGHAADIAVPVDSHKGNVIAAAALVAAGVPRARARRMARHGGLWTLHHSGYRIQVIWKTYSGGNHHNHVHIGIRRG